jgi:aldose 1-epimerase
MFTEFRFSFEGNTLGLDVQAMTDRPCPVNITYHPYFNLTNGGATPCRDHQLQINASFYTHTDSANLPTGEVSRAPCSGLYRYNDPRPINPNDLLDQNFIIKSLDAVDNKMVKMAKLSSDVTGHKVIICSTQSCLQAYTGGYIPTLTGKAGLTYGANHGVALEPQSFPDAVNQESFPDNILRPGEIYNHRINYTFRPREAQA